MSTTTTLRQRLRGWPGGVALMIIGGAVAAAGLLQTTSSTFTSGADCPNGSALVSKFNYVGHSYVFEKPAGNATVVAISNGSATGGAWTATRPITAVILKGGPNSVVITLTPAQTSGAFSNHWLPTVGRGNYPDVSNVQFCGSTAVTTTTAAPTTTTTVKPTTTTAKPTTTTAAPTTTAKPTTTTAAPTTTAKPTTTTAAPTTTTNLYVTTTTRPPTTTTNLYSTTEPTDPPTTTRPPTTTTAAPTTTAPGATTTTARGATTTTAPGSTTTVVQVSGEELTASTSPVTTSTTIVPTDVRGRSLPRTGSSSTPLITLGLALLLAGAAVTFVAVRRDRG